MASSLDDSNEWELSKENVQPLRQGRKLASLTAALQPHSIDQQKIKQQKDLFEQELRTYDGDDPLEVWYQYIKWTEQAYPKGGKDGNLNTLLERCIDKFKEYTQYQNDPRNIEAWIKFANFCNDPIEIFTFMFDQDLGCQQAMLYEAWAWSLELVGNKKKANLVYLEGVKRGAEPVEVLTRKHQEFQARVVKEMMNSTESDEEVTEDQRTVLGQLRASGKHRSVGTTRTGAVKKASRGGLGLSGSRIVPQVQQTFQVFNDENAGVAGAPMQTGEWTTVPKRSQDNRENDKKPGPWNKVKLPQKGGIVSSSGAISTPAFTVHEDTHEDQPVTTLQKLPEWNDRVLSSKKAEKPPLHHIQRQQQPADQAIGLHQIPMYCKDKIYTGLNEFSFEEVRAAHIYAKRKKKEEEEKFLEEKRLIEEERQRVMLEREELAKQQERWREEMSEMNELRQQMRQQEQQINNEWKANAEEERAVIERSFQNLSVAGLNSDGQNSADRSERRKVRMTQQLNFDEITMPGTVITDRGQCHAAQVRNESLNNSARTPSLTLPMNSTHSSGSRSRSIIPTPDSDSFHNGRGALTAPSPTVCTLEAINAVRGMFNSSLESDNRLNVSNTMDFKDLFPVHQPGGELITDQQAPFSIYSEDQPAPAIQIYCDDQENKENCIVPRNGSIPFKRKALTGILQPSLSVPVDPTGENDYVMEEKEHQIADGCELMEGIERHAHDDFTIAAVGSSESFSAAAKCASTPYNLARQSEHLLSSSRTHQSSITQSNVTQSNVTQSNVTQSNVTQPNVTQSNVTQSNVTQPQSFDVMMATPSKKGLSPILEGLSEGSSEESKSQASSLASRSASLSMFHQSHAHTSSVESGNKHLIDMTTYVTPEFDEKTEALLNMSVRIDPHNPFDEATVAAFLESLTTPLTDYPNYFAVDIPMPKIVANDFIILGNELYDVVKSIQKGGFGTIFLVDESGMENMLDVVEDTKVALKVQQPACHWEFYICCEIAKRLRQLEMPIDITPSIMSIKKGYFFKDGSCLINQYHKDGSLLDVVNQFIKNKELMGMYEPFAMYITIELLTIIENLHKCHIIHGDVKPDNFLFMTVPFCGAGHTREKVFGSCTKCLKLIDFGRSIDMTKYPPKTVFMAQSNTSGFQCIEMKTNTPWTYQTDLFGLAGTVHVVIFNSYMKVYQEKGMWHMTSSFVRKWNVPLWKRLFDTLLNVPSCDEIPDLSKLRTAFEDYFLSELANKYNHVAEIAISMLLKDSNS